MKKSRDRTNRGWRRLRRPGVTVILVLGMLTIALAVSYTMVRTQLTSGRMQQNFGRRGAARQAAAAGMSFALRKIHLSSWQGVEVSINKQLSADEWFEVTFETGDSSLQQGDAEYAEYPYRLTITSIGYSQDPADSNLRAEHRVKAVVQLVRRAVDEPPTGWSDVLQRSIYQWSDAPCVVQVPVRAHGPVLVNGQLALCPDYPADTPARSRYLVDLESMRGAGLGDFRPFTGPLQLPYSETSAETLALLASMNISTVDTPASNSPPVAHPGTISSYRLYPGGKQYLVPTIQDDYGSTLWNLSIGPDPLENPLGLYLSSGDLILQDNVTIEGTIVGNGGVTGLQIQGENVQLNASDLPPLAGSSERRQLPVAMLAEDFRVADTCRNGAVNGMAVVWETFEFEQGQASAAVSIRGQLVVNRLNLEGRAAWDASQEDWANWLADFLNQLGDPLHPDYLAFFPQWLERERGFAAEPLLTVEPESSAVTYHWQDWDNPIFVPHVDDEGLRWDLIRWQDDP